MPYYHTCKLCGANLDPGERCDCQGSKKPGLLTTVPGQRTPTKETEGLHDKYSAGHR